MQVNSKNLREIESIQLNDCITSIDTSSNYIAVGCLDDNLYVWQSNLAQFKKQPKFTNEGNSMGIVDISFDRNQTFLAVSHMDFTIKLYELVEQSIYQCGVMENWKISPFDESFITCGDAGKITFCDPKVQQKQKKIDAGDIFLTALATSRGQGFIATGNNNGDLYIIKTSENKNKIASLKPHYKLIRQLAFLDDSSKLLTASDDCSIKIIDISSEKVVSVLEGHKQAVSSISPQLSDPKIVFSSSFDKTIKSWDLRMKSCIGTQVTASPLWDIKSMGKHLLAGGENGILNIYSVQ